MTAAILTVDKATTKDMKEIIKEARGGVAQGPSMVKQQEDNTSANIF